MPISPTHLSPFDLTVVALYLVAITIFGLRFSKAGKASGDKSLKSYFLANNTIPWWAIGLSIVSAETSTLTIISIPGVAFAGNFGFLQVVLGYMLGRIVVALLFLPRYFRGEMLTAYQLIDRRFGTGLYKLTAGLFLLTRAAAEGVRVFAISIVVGIAIGTGDTLSIFIISALTLLYTFEGGMAAVIWTDVVQMALYVGGTLVAIWSLGGHVPGGWAQIHAVAAPLGKFHVLNFAMNLTTAYTFWAGVLGGTFLTMASHGTDQLMVQRMLAARNLRESRLALLSSGVVIFVQFTLFLLIGVGLFVFYGLHPQVFASSDRIFPTFIVHEMPHGVAGLLVAAILAAAMSNLSAALNSLASTTVVDFWVPFRVWREGRGGSHEIGGGSAQVSEARPGAPGLMAGQGEHPTLSGEAGKDGAPRGLSTTLVSRRATVFWVIVLFGIAVYSVRVGGKGHVVEIALSIAAVAYGCLLGVFLLGTLTKFATQTGAMVGMFVGFCLNVWLWQGRFPVQVGPVVVPHVAFTWYVLIGAVVTFGVGALFSVALPRRRVFALLLVLGLVGTAGAQDFSGVSTVVNQAIAEKKLPGAVVVVGHGGKVVFEQAYGVRKVAGEPGVDGVLPVPAAEAMTTDTLFDMASLTKCLATTTAVLQLYEAGKVKLDAPVATYLPAFAANGKGGITVRELMTHYSGLSEDVALKDPWGLAAPDKAEGIKRAMAAVPYGPAGLTFKYSDINFITLGALVEAVSGQRLEEYVRVHVFLPLGMAMTGYRAFDRTCGPVVKLGAAVYPGPKPVGRIGMACPVGTWGPYGLDPMTAPTAHDDQGTVETNPDFDRLLRGTVHDPTTRRMGGVAGHAGVFSTAADMSLFAQGMLDRLLRDEGAFPLKQATLRMAVSPQAPVGASAGATVFLQDGTPAKGVAQRGLGWDLNSAFSRPRGEVFPVATAGKMGSFGHTGFTGTSLWVDPTTDTYVILLANAIHPRGGAGSISGLRGAVATAVGRAIRACDQVTDCPGVKVTATEADIPLGRVESTGLVQPDPCGGLVICDSFGAPSAHEPRLTRVGFAPLAAADGPVLTGIDVLEKTHFLALTKLAEEHDGHLRLGLVTNQNGVDARGQRTIDLLLRAGHGIELKTLFTPEHGLYGRQDTEAMRAETDPVSHLPVIGLYGAKKAERMPKQADLKQLDAVVIDLQDAGVRFWTYTSVLGYFLEAAAQAHVTVVVLDRPNPVGGLAFGGPMSDPGSEKYTNFMPSPVRHGMTFGELAEYYNTFAKLAPQDPALLDARTIRMGTDSAETGPPATRAGLGARLVVVRMEGWRRGDFYAETGVPWVAPSPNLKTPVAAVLYPAVGLVEMTNVSVGRGSTAPFENVGAPYIDGKALAAYLTGRGIAGVEITPTTLTIAEDANKYPSHGATIPAVHLRVTDRVAFDSPEFGVELLAALWKLYPKEFKLELAKTLLVNADTLAGLKAGKDPREIAAGWQAGLRVFGEQRGRVLMYP